VFLNVRLRTFCHATENPSKVKRALEFLLPPGTISENRTTGHHGNPIVVYEVKTEKRTEIKRFWDIIKSSVPEEVLLEDLEERIDKDCVLYARLDKQKAYLGNIEMVKHEDVIAVTSKIESYPKNRTIAIRNAKEFFSGKG
jgi:RNA binding exosome subunit